MSKTPIKVSVVIAHVNAIEDLKATIKSHVQALKGINYEIVVCDNNSEIETIQALRTYLATRTDTKLVFENIKGTVAPFQKAAQAAVGEYLCISDQHVRVAPDFYRQQLAILDNDKSIGTLYSKCYFSLDKEDDFSYHYNFGYTGNWKSSFSVTPLDTKPHPIFVNQMGAALTRRKMFMDFGMFSATCFNKWGGYTAEELLLGLKTWMWGKKVYSNPNTWYRHYAIDNPDSKGIIKNQPEAMATVAYLLDGEQRLHSVIDAWGTNLVDPTLANGVYATHDEAFEDIKSFTEDDRQWLLQNQKYSFSDILTKFEEETLWT